MEHGFEHKQEKELTTRHGQNTEVEITSLDEDQKPTVIMAGSSNLTGTQANLLSLSNDHSDRPDECCQRHALRLPRGCGLLPNSRLTGLINRAS